MKGDCMSDADNQMGGDDAGTDNASAEAKPKQDRRKMKAEHDDELADQEGEESFPASDPPGNY
jgi:hypothetical protein